MTLARIPEQDVGGKDNKRSDELRIRASNLELAGWRAYARWPRNFHLHWVMFGAPHNRAARLTLWRWISRFRRQTRPVFRHRGAIWHGSNGNYYRVRNTSPGRFPAALKNGLLTASMKQAKMPYETVFRAPLEIADGRGNYKLAEQ
ncbi:hypothetical protein ACP0HM_19375 [Escherichia coli]